MTESLEDARETPSPGPANGLAAALESLRPRQWVKNALLLGAPAAAGVLDQREIAATSAAAVVSFCLAAGAIYVINDLVDRESDRNHPTKRHRPIASGRLAYGPAVATAVAALALSGLGAAAVGERGFLLCLIGYVAQSVAYSAGLKTVPVVELAIVASGFVLRLAAGAFAVEVPISDWFLIVGMFGSLLVVTGKRLSERRLLGDASADHRAVLGQYPTRYLELVMAACVGVVLLAYCLWALESAEAGNGSDLYLVSIAPFSVAVLTYVFAVESGRGGEPEEVFLRDRTIQVMGLAWTASYGAALYL